jgi:hypothetical protein
MKKKFFLLLLVLLSVSGFAQVVINTDGSSPVSSAMLEVTSNDKGLLPPRMTREQMNHITDPAPGLIVFCNDCKGLYIRLDETWREITLSPSVGDTYGGGVIFYIDETGQNGLISATSDQSDGAAEPSFCRTINGNDHSSALPIIDSISDLDKSPSSLPNGFSQTGRQTGRISGFYS